MPTPPSPIRAIFFDAVGTVLFPATSVSRFYAETARRHGVDLDEATLGKRLQGAFQDQESLDSEHDWTTAEAREFERWRSIVHQVLQSESSDSCFQELWEHYAQPEAWKLNPDVANLFPELISRGLKLGLASNFDGRLARIFASFPAFDCFEGRCLISSLVGHRKPSARFFQAIATSVSLAPGEILYVGDDLRNDVEGALQVGMRAIHLDPKSNIESATVVASLGAILRELG